MEKKFYIWILIGVLFTSINAFGQKKVVVVQPDAGLNVGALNTAIKSATDPGNTIFELKRGGLYLLNGAISHSGYNLNIRAEAGNGPRPILQPAVDALGTSTNHFNPGGSLTLEGLYIQGKDELGAVEVRLIIVAGTGNRIYINDCYFDYADQSIVRLSSTGNKVFIKNSIIRNSLRPDNPTNGRIIDTRANPTDTISIENSTIYNCYADLIYRDNGFVKYLKFDHNTVFQSSQFRYFMDIDHVLKADVTNNIFYNFGCRADSATHDALFAVDSMFTVGEYNDSKRYFDLSNNNWYNQPEIGAAFDQSGLANLYRFASKDKAHKDTIWYKYSLRKNVFANQSILDTAIVTKPPILMNFIKAGQVDTSNVFKESLKFKNPPPLNLDYFKFYIGRNYSIAGTNPPNPFADEDNNVLGEVTTGAYDFSYNSNSRSAKAAKGGLPLGASKWVLYTSISAKDIKADNSGNVITYPNPATGNVIFEIESKESASARIIVYDLLGKQLVTMEKQLVIGKNQVLVDISRISFPGIYLYQVQMDNSGNKSVVSGKLIKN